ncbi:P-loop containing nucleoside triphosphate hydrolase protein [Polyplosphaeria fusca]|uniref:P-loop containing nucleoside triphosphate hydrolase protein n=1 Tax=Polyplosphaeria fusca TaxID=682080 RepID=A0A9P4QRV9_9PLEO|nr:P-loop containing nucleoside triphosphate hydrolase protein [Polyplosphaeria fusca]
MWTRKFDPKNKYEYSEVQIVSPELHDLFRIELGHDPRLHFSSDNSKNDTTIRSPFEPLIHRWQRFEELVQNECDSEVWVDLKKRMAEQRPSSTITFADDDEKESERAIKARADLGALLQQVRTTPEVNTFLNGLESATGSGAVHFEHLWTLFPPGELVYASPFMDLDQVFVVKSCTHHTLFEANASPTIDSRRYWYLWCWTYDWNGKSFNRVPVMFKVEQFPGSRMVNTLPCHPLRFHFSGESAEGDMDRFKKRLIKRGEDYRSYCISKSGRQMFRYEGDSISHGSGFQRLKGGTDHQNKEEALYMWIFGNSRKSRSAPNKQSEYRQTSGKVMVDFESYIQHAPNSGPRPPMGDILYPPYNDECRCSSCTGNVALRISQRRQFDNYTAKIAFEDEQYLICPPRVLGYHLEARTWLELRVDQIQVISQPVSDAAFKKLQLNKTFKDLIKDLVESHTSGTNQKPLMEDIVEGKGRGLVILLHGPPGVGKTLTAESVATMAGKPLFAVSPSDIGLDPADVEHNLESLFELAARWRAVLLFDEADVFLESRSSYTSDLTRNALVSVLLRVLEYYSGILILTTNRINQFDIAVQSRVNLGIKYEDLKDRQKNQIFKNFIDSIKDGKVENRDDILEWLEEDPRASEWFGPLNGRQVRNVLFSAASLAMKESGTLKLKHIQTMAETTHKFQDSLKVVVQTARVKAEAGRFGD